MYGFQLPDYEGIEGPPWSAVGACRAPLDSFPTSSTVPEPFPQWPIPEAFYVPQQPWGNTSDDIYSGSGHYHQDPICNGDPRPEFNVDWSDLVVSDTAPGYTVVDNTTPFVPATSYTRSFDGTDLGPLHAQGEPVNVASSSFTGQQAHSQMSLYTCSIDSCHSRFPTLKERGNHTKAMHQNAFACNQCVYVGKSAYEVALHASSTSHASFICRQDGCERSFSRLDTYQRHQRVHQTDAKRFPCRYCNKYRGKNGFKRKDHLTQHTRNYHRIGEDETTWSWRMHKWCPKEGCPEFMARQDTTPEMQGAFASSKAWYKHMRTVHDESDFPCPRPGCDRINGKGYFRQADLSAHLRKVHGNDGFLEGDRPM